jgi:molybdopterin-guanine dinucleotide biosynthesis protein B
MTSMAVPRRAGVIGIAGWKNSGKTTLAVRLIAEFKQRGLRVASIKHAHHNFQIDDAETDSARHRQAGATQVAIVSGKRWALVTELGDKPEPSLDDVIAMLAPHDLVIVEGYKSEPIPKIEARRRWAAEGEPLAPHDTHVIAIATDEPANQTGAVPIFHLNDVTALADFIEHRLRARCAFPENL